MHPSDQQRALAHLSDHQGREHAAQRALHANTAWGVVQQQALLERLQEAQRVEHAAQRALQEGAAQRVRDALAPDLHRATEAINNALLLRASSSSGAAASVSSSTRLWEEPSLDPDSSKFGRMLMSRGRSHHNNNNHCAIDDDASASADEQEKVRVAAGAANEDEINPHDGGSQRSHDPDTLHFADHRTDTPPPPMEEEDVLADDRCAIPV
jgi:hypothetical protein